MSDPNWGMLSKSQSDNETIEEAIARVVEEHNEDEASHLETGQSLQSHKASEIIDHLAESIVIDKFEKNFYNKQSIVGALQSLDNFTFSGYSCNAYLSGVQLTTNTTLNNLAELYAKANTDFDCQFDNNPILEIAAKVWGQGTYEAYFGLGDRSGSYDECFAGFKVVSGTLYARTYSTTSGDETLTEIAGITVTNFNYYRVEYTEGVNCKFYVNGVLSATITTDLPDGENAEIFYSSVKTTQTLKQAYLRLKPFNFRQDD
jgi:hypothetical protein